MLKLTSQNQQPKTIYLKDYQVPDYLIRTTDLRFEIYEGEFFVIMGLSGSGKSTLINILAGTVIKTSGEVRVMGVDIDYQPKRARSLIGVVPQEIVTDTFFPF